MLPLQEHNTTPSHRDLQYGVYDRCKKNSRNDRCIRFPVFWCQDGRDPRSLLLLRSGDGAPPLSLPSSPLPSNPLPRTWQSSLYNLHKIWIIDEHTTKPSTDFGVSFLFCLVLLFQLLRLRFFVFFFFFFLLGELGFRSYGRCIQGFGGGDAHHQITTSAPCISRSLPRPLFFSQIVCLLSYLLECRHPPAGPLSLSLSLSRRSDVIIAGKPSP